MGGTLIVKEGKVVRPSRLIASVVRTAVGASKNGSRAVRLPKEVSWRFDGASVSDSSLRA